MKAIALKVRDTIQENDEFFSTVGHLTLLSFGASIIIINLSYLV